MNTVEEHDHPTNHRLREEGMDMVGIHVMKVDDMDMVEELPINHRTEVDGTDREDSNMVEVKVVEREHESVVLVRHWSRDASASSLGMGGACKVGMFRMSHHICKSGL
jgi:hypothetical protein